MNLIVDKSPAIRWYTDLYPFVFRARGRVEQYAWLMTNISLNANLPFEESPQGAYWVPGRDLAQYVSQTRPQFSWGVLSAIPADREILARNDTTYPFADGNSRFWNGSPRPQHPFAEFEIVCWDSSATLLIGADEEIGHHFKDAYPGTVDLDAENLKRA
jgi:hypothetical protein